MLAFLLSSLFCQVGQGQEVPPQIGFVPFAHSKRSDGRGMSLPNPDLGPQKLAYQGEYVYVVQLDRYGRPCPNGEYLLKKTYAEHMKNVGLQRNHNLISIPVLPDPPGYYLFCSGRLVHYKYVSGEAISRVYIPDGSGKIISLDAYMQGDEIIPAEIRDFREVFGQTRKRSPHFRKIYLLPGFFFAFNNLGSKIIGSTTIADYPKQPAPFVEVPPTADDLKQIFVPDYSARFAIRFRNLIYTVTIDKETGHYLFEDFAKKMDASTASRTELPPWLLKPRQTDESVYEHKQGMLIPGFLHEIGTEEWVFVPDLGGKCIPMESYLKSYHPKSRRIYNLPGKFEIKK